MTVETKGAEFRIDTYTAGDQSDPSVTALTDGGFVVAWESGDGSGDDIYGQRYDADGNRVRTEFRINEYTEVDEYLETGQDSPSVTALTDGGFVVAWQSGLQDGDGWGIYGQRYDAQGNALGGEFRVNATTEGHQTGPFVAGLSGGGFVVAWESSVQVGLFDHDYIYGQRYDAQGNAQGTEFRVNTDTSENDNPSVTGLSDGGFVVTWDSSSNGVYGQRYDAQGNAQGAEFYDERGNAQVAEFQISSKGWDNAVAALTDGGFVVAWRGLDGRFSGGVYGQRYDADGNAQGGEFLVNATTEGNQENPSVTGLSDGGFVVTWESSQYWFQHVSDGQDGSGAGVYGQRYDANSNRVGTEFHINTHTPGNQNSPSVTALFSGGFVVAWESLGQDGDGYGVYGQLFLPETAIPPTETAIPPTETVIPPTETVIREGTDGDDTIEGGAAPDLIEGLAGNDRLIGGAGNDEIFAGHGNDYAEGGQGDDEIGGGVGNDELWGGDGNDTIYGGADDDRIGGGAGNDELWGGDGADTIYGGADDDLIGGGVGNDELWGGDGADTIYGGAGDDRIGGGVGNDELWGGDGADTIYGGADDDLIGGGAGNDELTGGAGGDVFVFNPADGVVGDTIVDFEDGTDIVRILDGSVSFGDLDITDSGGNASVTWGNGNTLTFTDLDHALLTADDFAFVL